MNIPIRLRLAAWYFTIMLVTLSLFGAGMYVAMRLAVRQAADRDLRLHLTGAEEFVKRHATAPPDRLQREVREHAGLRPGGELLQIGTPGGDWLFQSDAMLRLGITLGPRQPPGAASNTTISIRGMPIEILTEWVDVGRQTYGFQAAVPMDSSFAILRRFAWLLVGCIPALVMLASIGGYAMSRQALAPIRRITREAQTITAEQLSKRLEVPESPDELQSLSLTLNAMMDRLERSFRNIGQFTADASHELRTPVSLIRSTAELALMGSRDEEFYRAALRDNLEESERMTVLIDDLLTLARADSGDGSPRMVEMDLREPLRQAFHLASKAAAAKPVEMVFDLPDKRLTIQGDPAALRRLFSILVDNGVKYTPEGGRVVMAARHYGGEIVVNVEDSGIGISSNDQSNIFERFYRADKAHSHGGAGLGLSIAKCIAISHGVVIGVESAPGQGSRFSVRFQPCP